jgi:hypothetical protein
VIKTEIEVGNPNLGPEIAYIQSWDLFFLANFLFLNCAICFWRQTSLLLKKSATKKEGREGRKEKELRHEGVDAFFPFYSCLFFVYLFFYSLLHFTVLVSSLILSNFLEKCLKNVLSVYLYFLGADFIFEEFLWWCWGVLITLMF